MSTTTDIIHFISNEKRREFSTSPKLIAALIGWTCILLILVAIICIRKRRIKAAKNVDPTVETPNIAELIIRSASSLRSFKSGKSTKSSKGVKSGMLDVPTVVEVGGESKTYSAVQIVFSIPGYLMVEDQTDFRIDHSVAKGGGGEIFIGRAFKTSLLEYGDAIIVKKIMSSKAGVNRMKEKMQFDQELSITAYLQTCKNIVRLLGYCNTPQCLILKFYKVGSLREWMHKMKKVRKKRIVFDFLADISHGLSAMHCAGFVHCDLKPDNILIDFDEKLNRQFGVITDMGISQVVDSKILLVKEFPLVDNIGLSMLYASPEVITNFRKGVNSRTYSADTYAYGMIYNYLFTGGTPKFAPKYS
eukprot:Partr_v1_DN27820_c3_g1_i2_m22771 putative protein kinase kinase kinase